MQLCTRYVHGMPYFYTRHGRHAAGTLRAESRRNPVPQHRWRIRVQWADGTSCIDCIYMIEQEVVTGLKLYQHAYRAYTYTYACARRIQYRSSSPKPKHQRLDPPPPVPRHYANNVLNNQEYYGVWILKPLNSTVSTQRVIIV